MPQRGYAAGRPSGPVDAGARPYGPIDTAPVTAPTVAEAVDKLFTRYDANADGSITSTEILAVLDPDASSTNLATRLASVIAAIDGNADGKLTTDEVRAAVNALDTDADGTVERGEWWSGVSSDSSAIDLGLLLRAHAGRDGGYGFGGYGYGYGNGEPRTLAEVAAGAFERLDADDSATVTLSEALSYMTAHSRGADLTAEFTNVFKVIDANADGSITLAELTSAIGSLDSNQNGLLDTADISLSQIDGLTVALTGVLMHDLGISC